MERKLCKYCEQSVVRIKIKKNKDGDRFVYSNEDGRQWKGARCPDCWAKKLKENYQRRVI